MELRNRITPCSIFFRRHQVDTPMIQGVIKTTPRTSFVWNCKEQPGIILFLGLVSGMNPVPAAKNFSMHLMLLLQIYILQPEHATCTIT